jgi:hypothetical protein
MAIVSGDPEQPARAARCDNASFEPFFTGELTLITV